MLFKKHFSAQQASTKNEGKTRSHKLKGRRKPVKKTTIRKKLLLSTLSLTVAISVCTSVALCGMFYRNTKTSMEQQVSRVAVAYNAGVENAIENYRLKIKSMATNADITNPQAKSQWGNTLTLLAARDEFDQAGLADSSGKTLDGQNFSNEDFFKNALMGDTVLSTICKNPKTGSMVMYAATRVDNGTNYDGIVYGIITAPEFNQVISNLTLGDKGYGFIVDDKGTVIANRNSEEVTKQINYIQMAKKDPSYQSLGALVEKMTERLAGGMYVDTADGEKYVFYAPILGTTWSLGAVADKNEMMADFNRSILITALLALLFIGLSIVLSFRISGSVSKPIVLLMERMKGLSEGDLHTSVPQIHTGNEVQTLSETFSGSLDALNAYIGEISSVLGSIAQGDLTVQTTQEYKGDFVAIKKSLGEILASLSLVFSEIRTTAEQVANGSRQMSDASQSLAQGAAEQNATIQELSGSVCIIAKQAKDSAESAESAEKISEKAAEKVSDGTEHMKRLTESMNRISDSSDMIGKVIKTIQDIAFQTNILALNAAVEAARAGEAGRGFSVVADEVRNLATRSANAVKSTAALIQDSATAVRDGEEIAKETGDYLSGIIADVSKMNSLLQSIASAAENQASSVGAVNVNVGQISAVVQTNSATAEESAATSEELSRLAGQLSAALGRLRISDQYGQNSAEASDAAFGLSTAV